MNSAFLDRVQGFLKRRSASHSVERCPKSVVTPPSSSSQFSIGVTSAATLGPKLDAPSLRLRPAAPPSSTIAAGSLSLSLSGDCAKALPEQRSRDASNTYFVAFMTTPPARSDSSRLSPFHLGGK